MVCGNSDGWVQIGVSQRDWIKAAFGEGMATGKTAEGQPGALDDTETDQGDVGVLRAGGEIEALGRAEGVEDRRQDRLVDAIDDADCEAGLRIWHRFRRHGVA
jgi:hypothetical protein